MNLTSTSRDVERRLRRLSAQVGPKLEDASHALRVVDRDARRFIHEYPLSCLLGAIAAGFLLGRIGRDGT
jgi:hypothetical protein